MVSHRARESSAIRMVTYMKDSLIRDSKMAKGSIRTRMGVSMMGIG
jgi:hypothetical protein